MGKGSSRSGLHQPAVELTNSSQHPHSAMGPPPPPPKLGAWRRVLTACVSDDAAAACCIADDALSKPETAAVARKDSSDRLEQISQRLDALNEERRSGSERIRRPEPADGGYLARRIRASRTPVAQRTTAFEQHCSERQRCQLERRHCGCFDSDLHWSERMV